MCISIVVFLVDFIGQRYLCQSNCIGLLLEVLPVPYCLPDIVCYPLVLVTFCTTFYLIVVCIFH